MPGHEMPSGGSDSCETAPRSVMRTAWVQLAIWYPLGLLVGLFMSRRMLVQFFFNDLLLISGHVLLGIVLLWVPWVWRGAILRGERTTTMLGIVFSCLIAVASCLNAFAFLTTPELVDKSIGSLLAWCCPEGAVLILAATSLVNFLRPDVKRWRARMWRDPERATNSSVRSG